MKKEECDFMIEEISRELILLLTEEHNMTMREAFDMLYTSDTYARLLNTKNGLYAQSTAYIYEYLEEELQTGRINGFS